MEIDLAVRMGIEMKMDQKKLASAVAAGVNKLFSLSCNAFIPPSPLSLKEDIKIMSRNWTLSWQVYSREINF